MREKRYLAKGARVATRERQSNISMVLSGAVMLLAIIMFAGQVLAADFADINGDRIINADQEPGNWLSHGRDYGEQRFSPLTKVNKGNVKDLGLAWHFDMDTHRGLETTPIVVDGTMFISSTWSRVYALDAKTGELKWEYDPEVPRHWGRYGCCDVVNRGVAVWKGQVFVGVYDGRLVALDAENGKVNWEVNTTGTVVPYTITGAPRVVKDMVIIGNGGAELGARGYFTAYDVETGKQKWRFYTVPGNPNEPFEHPELKMAAETWKGGKWWEIGGGGTVWDSMAFDPELNLLYVGVGNGSPWNHKLRSPGGGDNLFLSSILAIDPDLGRLVWHYQTTPGENWDYTATQHMVLADMEIEGKQRKVIMQAPKNGFFYVLDRTSGELLSAEKYVHVTWASHVDMKTGRPVKTVEGKWDDGEVKVISPSALGGHNWHPMSYSPNTGLVYIPAQEIPGMYQKDPNFKYRSGAWNTGGINKSMPDVPPEFVSGHLLAWDPVNQKEAWRHEHWGPWNGGTLATASDLVFQGTGDGFFRAYDAAKGGALWEAKVQTGVIAAPIAYEIDGEQYVAIQVGWGGAYALAFGRAAKRDKVKGNEGRMLVFKLGADGKLPPTDYEERGPTLMPDTADEATIKKGYETYQEICAVCHGVGAVSGGVLPDLRYSLPEVYDIWPEIILEGAFAHNGMASFKDLLNKEDVMAIQAWVIRRAHEGDIPIADYTK